MFKSKTINILALSLPLLFLMGCQQLPFEDTAAETVPQPITAKEPVKPPACECPVAEVPDQQSCPEVSTAPTKVVEPAIESIDELLIIGRVENAYVQPDNIKFKARIDTGAGLTSIHAVEIIEFERDGEPWVKFKVPVKKQDPIAIERPIERFVEIKQQSGEPQRRPVVLVSIKLGSIEEQVEITLTDRGEYVYPILIGRNFLRDQAIVDVSKKFTIKYPK